MIISQMGVQFVTIKTFEMLRACGRSGMKPYCIQLWNSFPGRAEKSVWRSIRRWNVDSAYPLTRRGCNSWPFLCTSKFGGCNMYILCGVHSKEGTFRPLWSTLMHPQAERSSIKTRHKASNNLIFKPNLSQVHLYIMRMAFQLLRLG